jgi:multiple sugar transport system ATP-binding protein
VYVTHDQVEALSMGDRIAIMNAGRIVQVGAPLEIYDAPADRFVGGFIGDPPMNFLEATPERVDGRIVAAFGAAGSLPVRDGPAGLESRVGKPIVAGVRAENIEVVEGEPSDGLLRARTLVVEPLGSHNLVTLDLAGQMLKATTPPGLIPAKDVEVGLRIDGARIRWLDPETGQALEPAPGAATTPGAATAPGASNPPA